MIQTDIFANVGRIFMIAGMKGISNGLAKPNGKTRRVSYGDGLVRMDRPGGTSSWVCRLQKHGVRRDFGLGSCQKVSLAQARELAREIRSQIELGNRHACPTPLPAALVAFGDRADQHADTGCLPVHRHQPQHPLRADRTNQPWPRLSPNGRLANGLKRDAERPT